MAKHPRQGGRGAKKNVTGQAELPLAVSSVFNLFQRAVILAEGAYPLLCGAWRNVCLRSGLQVILAIEFLWQGCKEYLAFRGLGDSGGAGAVR